MKAVGVKVLKDNLSRYLRCVREGETVYVTDRDTIVAEIRRPVNVAGRADAWQGYLDEAARRGALYPARAPGGPSLAHLAKAAPPPPSTPELQHLLDAIRAD